MASDPETSASMETLSEVDAANTALVAEAKDGDSLGTEVEDVLAGGVGSAVVTVIWKPFAWDSVARGVLESGFSDGFFGEK